MNIDLNKIGEWMIEARTFCRFSEDYYAVNLMHKIIEAVGYLMREQDIK
jgi:hypothetical protein